MMRALLWVPDEGAGGALVGTSLAPLPKRVRPLTPDEKAAHAAFEGALVKMHSAGTLPPGAQGLSPSRRGVQNVRAITEGAEHAELP
jgi:hypothetical protein